MTRKLLLGVAAGLLSAPLALILAYVVGVVVIAVTTREIFASLLAAATVLPLMLLFILLLPTIVIAFLVGVTIGIAGNVTSRAYSVGALAGLLFAEAVISGILPLIVVPQPGDFTSMISRPLLSGVYGVVIGLIAARLFRWFT